MSNAELKSKIIKLVEHLEEDTLLHEVYNLLDAGQSSSNRDWWKELSDAQRKGLQEGIEALDRGEHFSYDEVRQGIQDKFNI